MDADIVSGNIVSNEAIANDRDSSAAGRLVGSMKLELDDTMVTLHDYESVVSGTIKETIYTPPNMTNLFYFGLPVVPDKIYEAQKGLDFEKPDDESKDNFFVRVYLCNDPTRLNPAVVGKVLNERHGVGHWILATTDPSTGELRRVVAKPKSEWKISSRLPRANVPLTLY
jgi:hypothetical protein